MINLLIRLDHLEVGSPGRGGGIQFGSCIHIRFQIDGTELKPVTSLVFGIHDQGGHVISIHFFKVQTFIFAFTHLGQHIIDASDALLSVLKQVPGEFLSKLFIQIELKQISISVITQNLQIPTGPHRTKEFFG